MRENTDQNNSEYGHFLSSDQVKEFCQLTSTANWRYCNLANNPAGFITRQRKRIAYGVTELPVFLDRKINGLKIIPSRQNAAALS